MNVHHTPKTDSEKMLQGRRNIVKKKKPTNNTDDKKADNVVVLKNAFVWPAAESPDFPQNFLSTDFMRRKF